MTATEVWVWQRDDDFDSLSDIIKKEYGCAAAFR